MKQSEMLVIKRGYDFSKWLLQHTGKFPKSYRFSVAVRMENAILEFIELTTVANTRDFKLPLLKIVISASQAGWSTRARRIPKRLSESCLSSRK